MLQDFVLPLSVEFGYSGFEGLVSAWLDFPGSEAPCWDRQLGYSGLEGLVSGWCDFPGSKAPCWDHGFFNSTSDPPAPLTW